MPTSGSKTLRRSVMMLLVAGASHGCFHEHDVPADQAVPHLPRWQPRVEEIHATIPHGGVRILFLGDSITEGWTDAGADAWDQSFRDLEALPLGVSGDRTQTLLHRLNDDRLDQLQPQLVVLMIGTNNAADGFHGAADIAAGTQRVLEVAHERWPTARCLLLAALPRDSTETVRRGRLLQSSQILNGIYQDDARVRFLDLGYLFVEADGSVDRSLMPDDLHPGPAGYEVLASRIRPVVLDMLRADPGDGTGHQP